MADAQCALQQGLLSVHHVCGVHSMTYVQPQRITTARLLLHYMRRVLLPAAQRLLVQRKVKGEGRSTGVLTRKTSAMARQRVEFHIAAVGANVCT